ncbi:uncharacterized protein EMH_0033090 [Eimeria mitis]|uniref:Uncharacterized protein n=1 Tax=Eimeria mitis TaxID=44415 RepID=U6JU36_9EIME|nr:uncharacterized protein EMH_0033090 [Eimeria mitis]CDJ27582.1 hypothetical protein, conserved [Eimeria mitis]
MGYFDPGLPVRCCSSDKFVPLNKMYPPPVRPFLMPPKPQATAAAAAAAAGGFGGSSAGPPSASNTPTAAGAATAPHITGAEDGTSSSGTAGTSGIPVGDLSAAVAAAAAAAASGGNTPLGGNDGRT